MSQSNPKTKQPPENRSGKTAGKASLNHADLVSNSKANVDRGKLALQVAVVAHTVKTIAQEYYQLEQSPQKPIDINHHVISGSALTLLHVCLLFAIHYGIAYFKAQPGAVKAYREAYRDIQDLSAQEAELSERLKESGGNR